MARRGAPRSGNAFGMGRHLEQLDLGLDLLPAPSVEQLLTTWTANGKPARRQRSDLESVTPGVQFALYGRVSTLEYQDPESSLGWQRDSALDVIADRGRIVAEFFDVGHSRTLPWAHRRQAARLPEALTDPARGFDAITVGESERAFTGTQLLHLAPVFLTHGVHVATRTRRARRPDRSRPPGAGHGLGKAVPP